MGSGISPPFLQLRNQYERTGTNTSRTESKSEINRREVIKEKIPLKCPPSKKLVIMIAHDNRKDFWTSNSHLIARLLEKHPNIEVVVDYKVWKSFGEKTSKRETNKRVSKMVQKSDLVLRFVPPTKASGERHEGPKLEINKARYAGKPIGEIMVGGAKQSPNNSLSEKPGQTYYQHNLQKGEPWLNGVKQTLKYFSEKGILPKGFKFKE